MRCDLHSHSSHSDGLLTPETLAARAAARGVETFALTDHDETSGLAAARRQAEESGMTFINGVEVSVTWQGRTVHVVGLHIDPQDAELDAGLGALRAGRDRRAEAMAAGLAKAGIADSLEGARRHAKNPALVGRTHFARHLVERGHARDVQAVFRNYLTPGKPGYVPRDWATLAQAVHWICHSGGMAVLAHPGRYRLDGAQREALLSEFRDAGGVGIEVVTGSHSADQFLEYARCAQHYGLLASMGSDFHGPAESRCDLGSLPGLPYACTPIWSRF